MRFSIETNNQNEKEIRFWGYFYTTDDTDCPYRQVMYYHDVLLLKDFLKVYPSIESIDDYIIEELNAKVYIEDETKEEVKDAMTHYFLLGRGESFPGDLLTINEVTMDTPCGFYREGNQIYS